MRALRRGLPMVGIPARGADRIPITQLIDHWGAGRAMPGDADALQIRGAVVQLLSNPDFRSEARRRSLAFAGKDGAQLAASSVESSSWGRCACRSLVAVVRDGSTRLLRVGAILTIVAGCGSSTSSGAGRSRDGEKEVVAGLAVQTTDPASRRGTSYTKLRSHWNRRPW